jgi:hypothetical protein
MIRAGGQRARRSINARDVLDYVLAGVVPDVDAELEMRLGRHVVRRSPSSFGP